MSVPAGGAAGQVMLALMLGRPAGAYPDTQRTAHLRRLRAWPSSSASDPEDTLVTDYGLFHLKADLSWIDATSERLSELAETVRAT
jgi:hypothetical protein